MQSKQLQPIPNFPAYSITKTGQVWSNHYGGRWLKFNLCNDGRLHVVLCKNGKTYPKLVHRLVLETYVSACPKGLECRHLDGDPLNNNIGNLKWGTKSENVRDAIRHGTFNAVPSIFPSNSGMMCCIHLEDSVSTGIIFSAAERLLLKSDPALSRSG